MSVLPTPLFKHPPPLRGQAFKALLADKPKTTRKHKETTTEATDATPE